MFVSRPTRRHVLEGMATLGVCGLIGTAGPRSVVAADDFTVGFVYIGPRIDWGWNQSFSDAAEAIGGLPGVMVVEAPYLPETTDYDDGKINAETKAYIKALERLIKPDGSRLIFTTTVGRDPILEGVVKGHPNVIFRKITNLAPPPGPKNIGSQSAHIHQGHYVNGVAAGVVTKSNKLGFVAGEAGGAILLNVNSFLMGCRKTNPKATVHVLFTGGWESEQPEVTATNKLIDMGCDVITCHSDSPKTIIETAESRGVRTCGHAYDQGPLAPKGYVTGADYVWAGMYEDLVQKARSGTPLPEFVTGGYDKGYVASSPFGAGATPEAVRAAKIAIGEMTANKPIFVGPIRDNTGKIVIPAGTTYGPYAPKLQKTDYLIDGVVGSIG